MAEKNKKSKKRKLLRNAAIGVGIGTGVLGTGAVIVSLLSGKKQKYNPSKPKSPLNIDLTKKKSKPPLSIDLTKKEPLSKRREGNLRTLTGDRSDKRPKTPYQKEEYRRKISVERRRTDKQSQRQKAIRKQFFRDSDIEIPKESPQSAAARERAKKKSGRFNICGLGIALYSSSAKINNKRRSTMPYGKGSYPKVYKLKDRQTGSTSTRGHDMNVMGERYSMTKKYDRPHKGRKKITVLKGV